MLPQLFCMGVEKELSMTSSYSIEKSALGLSGVKANLAKHHATQLCVCLAILAELHFKMHRMQPLPHATGKIYSLRQRNMSEKFSFIKINTHIEELI